MKVIDFKRGDIAKHKKVWKPAFGVKGKTALISCSVCGSTIDLSDYRIDEEDQGLVRPSVKCTACDEFHQLVRLVGWKD